MPASQTIVGIRNAFANEPPPEPADWTKVALELSSSPPRTIEQSHFGGAVGAESCVDLQERGRPRGLVDNELCAAGTGVEEPRHERFVPGE